jgi:hypothetical protein
MSTQSAIISAVFMCVLYKLQNRSELKFHLTETLKLSSWSSKYRALSQTDEICKFILPMCVYL